MQRRPLFARAALRRRRGCAAPRRSQARRYIADVRAGAFRAAWAFADIRRVSRTPGALRIRRAHRAAAGVVRDFRSRLRRRHRAALSAASRRPPGRSARRAGGIAALATTGVVVIAALVWIVIPALADRLRAACACQRRENRSARLADRAGAGALRGRRVRFVRRRGGAGAAGRPAQAPGRRSASTCRSAFLPRPCRMLCAARRAHLSAARPDRERALARRTSRACSRMNSAMSRIATVFAPP